MCRRSNLSESFTNPFEPAPAQAEGDANAQAGTVHEHNSAVDRAKPDLPSRYPRSKGDLATEQICRVASIFTSMKSNLKVI